MTSIYCPRCDKQTPTKLWDFLPWLKLARQMFWCRSCHQWFLFSSRSQGRAQVASIAAIFLSVGCLWLYFRISGTQRLSGWPVLPYVPAVLLLCNLASAWVLRRSAELVGPVDHVP